MKFRIFSLLLACLPNAAHAHLVSARFGEFYNGFAHPLMTLNQLLPWLALGLLAGYQDVRRARLSVVIFPLAVLIGALLSSIEALSTVAALLNSISLVLCALLVVLAFRLNFRLFCTLLIVFGLSHGIVNGEELLAGREKILFLAGLTASAYIVITLVSATSQAVTQRFTWGMIAVRALGSWMVAVGLIFIAFTATQPNLAVIG